MSGVRGRLRVGTSGTRYPHRRGVFYPRELRKTKWLRAPRPVIDAFLERSTRSKRHLGPILVQLPPSWRPDPARLAGFLAAASRRRRWSVEVRDARWLTEPVFEIPRRHGAALCIHDLIDDHPHEITAGWVYLRFHGDHDTGRYLAPGR